MSVKNFIRLLWTLLLSLNLSPVRAFSVGFDAFKYGPGPGGGGGNWNPDRWTDLNQRRSEDDRERDRDARALMDTLPATSADIDRQLRETHERGMRLIEEQHQQRMEQIDREDRQRRELSDRKFQEEMAQFDRARDRLLSLRDRRDRVQEQIRSMDHYETRREIVDTATGVLRISRDFVLKDQYEEFEWASNITEALLDLATSTLPGVSWGRDVYEAVSGKDLISGEILSPFSRSMSVAGAVSFGTGSMAKKAGKTFDFFKNIMKSGGRLASRRETLNAASHIIESTNQVCQHLTAGKIRTYLENVDRVPKPTLVSDMSSMGLKVKGNDETRRFLEFVDHKGRVRAKIHPPDVNTSYHHLHIYDKNGTPLNSLLKRIEGKKGRKRPEAHIPIMEF